MTLSIEIRLKKPSNKAEAMQQWKLLGMDADSPDAIYLFRH